MGIPIINIHHKADDDGDCAACKIALFVLFFGEAKLRLFSAIYTFFLLIYVLLVYTTHRHTTSHAV